MTAAVIMFAVISVIIAVFSYFLGHERGWAECERKLNQAKRTAKWGQS